MFFASDDRHSDAEIKKIIERENEFKCDICRHKGPLEADPPLPKFKQKDFIMTKTPKELLKNELVCYQTKISNRDQTLGIGISLKRSPVTGLVSYINPTMDLISMRAFTKLKIRNALAGERFTHWLPLYFGEDEIFEVEQDQIDISDIASMQIG